jgi:hypothetical protein
MPELCIESLPSMRTRRSVAAGDLLLLWSVEHNRRGPRPPRPKASDPHELESLSRGAPPRTAGKCSRASGFPDTTTVNSAPPNSANRPPGSHCQKVPLVLPLCWPGGVGRAGCTRLPLPLSAGQARWLPWPLSKVVLSWFQHGYAEIQ